jgi:transaldolase/transaldolase/glucose-6-phosphate isomerase
MNPLRQLKQLGQSVWFDNIHRGMITTGELAQMISEDGLSGITSNPTIFEKAVTGSDEYDEAIAGLLNKQPDTDNRNLFFTLAIDDIRAAADLMLPVYRDANGHDGLVSLEVSPDLADDTENTVREARELWEKVNRPNLMIKVPATKAGIPAVEELTADGINVNATLLFAVSRYREVVDAYLSGLESRLRRGQHLDHVASVASFFVSRVDTAIDTLLEEHSDSTAHTLRGKVAIANAKKAYQVYLEMFNSERFAELGAAGAKTQRLLWASSGTKNPEYSDTLYIDNLIGPDTVNTIPPATYVAFKDHGRPAATLETGHDEALAQLQSLADLGIDLDQVTTQLEHAGVAAFASSFTNLLDAIGNKASEMNDGTSSTG